MSERSASTATKPATLISPRAGLLQRKCACGAHTPGGGECAGCSKKKLGLQRKLSIGSVNDPLELEADRVANQVMAMPSHVGGGNEPARIQRFAVQPTGQSEVAPTSVDQVLASPGRPLEPVLQWDMEQRFGYDFSNVRVHSDSVAERSAMDVSAHAYTVGHQIVFGQGRYSPHSHAGKRLLSHELAHVVQQSRGAGLATGRAAEKPGLSPNRSRAGAAFGAIQRQAVPGPIAKHQATQEKSRMVRVERYWHSPSARVFFKDGSNEEVTFIEGSSLDTPAAPVRRYKKMVDLVIDRSSPIRPHLEVASHGTGSRVEVETRLSPADRIARLPASAQRQLTVGFQDADGESDPQAMEFMADMGDRLSESSTTMAIQMEGQDPATVSRMQTVDQWVEGQKDALSKVGAWGRGKFTQLLKDVRQIGVTGPAASEDLYPQDIELVLAGVAGGQSDFQTFAEFKRIFNWKLRTGSASLPQDATENPEFFIRNEYRVAWKAEAAGLRRMSRIAAAAQVAPFIAIGASALVGSGAAGLEALGAGALDWAAARGVSSSLVSKWIGTSLLASSGLGHLIGAGKEAKAAGMDTTSPLNLLNVVSTAALRTFGVGEIDESITDKSILTHQSFGRSPWERVVGGVQGGFDALGASSMFVPEAPNVADTSAPRPGKTPSEPDTSSQAPKPDPTLTVKPGGGAGSGKPTGMLRDTDSVSQGVEVDASHPVFKNKTPSNDPPVSPNSEAAKVAVNATHDVPHGQQIDHAPGTPVPGQDLGPARMGKTPPTPDPNLKSNSEPKTGAQSDISSADSRGVPELISDEAATDRIPAGQEVGEVVGDYRIAGDKSFDGHTFKRDIYGLTNLRGKTVNIGPIMQLFRDFVQEAKAVGAMELKITGNVIVNKNVMGMQRIVAEFGGTIRKTGPMSNEIIIPLK